MKRPGIWILVGFAVVLAACGNRTEQYILPDHVSDFATLFENNCAGCHGRDGRFGAARPLNDPFYLALIGQAKMRDVIAKGVNGTAMPAFAQNAGGALTDRQISILADQIEERWSRPGDLVGGALPPYSTDSGDAKHGKEVFGEYCSRCHGADGSGSAKGGSVVNPAFLALVSNQSLRTTVIVGRSDLGTPDWRSYPPGHAITGQEISDVVAWISAHRARSGNLANGGTNLP